jgi:hypothetical protein
MLKKHEHQSFDVDQTVDYGDLGKVAHRAEGAAACPPTPMLLLNPASLGPQPSVP